MIILLWCFCVILFLLSATLLAYALFKNPERLDFFRTFINGIKEGLSSSGFTFDKKYPVELWIWETTDDENVCDDCLERSSWPPMDIADWMREGLPRTPESETECCENCRCHLVPYRPKKLSKKPYRR